jgi:hypothetical protein
MTNIKQGRSSPDPGNTGNEADDLENCFLKVADRLLEDGRLRTAIDVAAYTPRRKKFSRALLKGLDFNKARSHAVAYLAADIRNADLQTLLVILTYSEARGHVATMREALTAIDDTLARGEHRHGDDRARVAALTIAIKCFFVSHARTLAGQIEDEALKSSYRGLLARYDAICTASGFGPAELEEATRSIMRNDEIRVDRDCVVVRVSNILWESVEAADASSPAAAGDLRLAEFLTKKGYAVRLAPQFSHPGPSLYTPFAREQEHALVFVDRHKYSSGGPFVHFKKTHNKQILIDRRGYSGWSEVQTMPHLHDFRSVPEQEARSYFREMSSRNFAASPPSAEPFADYGDYGILPMQIPGDSVLNLSRFDYFEIIDATIAFFASRKLNTVLRRHPKCKDREVTAYLNRLERKGGVRISTHSSRDMILHARAVAVCNSSMGWDAILAEKPLICFGLSEYSRVAYQVSSYADIEEAPALDRMFDQSDREKFVYYFWHRHVLNRTKDFYPRLEVLVRDVMTSGSTSVQRSSGP